MRMLSTVLCFYYALIFASGHNSDRTVAVRFGPFWSVQVPRARSTCSTPRHHARRALRGGAVRSARWMFESKTSQEQYGNIWKRMEYGMIFRNDTDVGMSSFKAEASHRPRKEPPTALNASPSVRVRLRQDWYSDSSSNSYIIYIDSYSVIIAHYILLYLIISYYMILW